MTSSIAKSGHAHARGRQSPGTMSGAYRNSQLRGRLRHGAHRRARAAGAARPLETAGRGEVIFASERAPGQEEPLGCSWRWRWGCESLDDGKTFGEMQGAANRRAGRARLRRRPLRYGRTSRADLRRLRVSRRPPLVRRRQLLLALQSRSSAPPIAVNSVDGGPGWRLLEGEMQSQSAGAREIECVRTGRLRAAHAQGWRAPTAPSLRSPFCCVHCIDA